MAHPKILVLGGTGPAGICLLRELLHRNCATVVYARNTSKIPDDIREQKLIELIIGEISDDEKLAAAMAKCSAVISLLGPDIKKPKIDPELYPKLYSQHVLPAMRAHGVKRIFVMGTVSIKNQDDIWTIFQPMVLVFMRLFASAIYQNMTGLADLFQKSAEDLDWTIFRIAQIPGESDEISWKADRESGEVFVGNVGQTGWTSSIKRAALARWLVDAYKSGSSDWIHKMPAVSRRS
ncbi:unnamed protein product [Clonostachys rhizophaga]|uniref:NAD(P)-binding domain-containing protein n=1 Tax=Clonostachys rhizophaga TaxID=160324 RepID=A0A9N9VKW7_9HYPO|nr:unnamed protein product [Clonostachys rhizophaga]